MRKYNIEQRRRGIFFIQQKEGRVNGLVTSEVQLPSKTYY
jgi:hypothetical protein